MPDTPAPQTSALVIEPDDKQAQIRDILNGATKSIDMIIYELVDPDIEDLLTKKTAEHVAVRVILDRNFAGRKNQQAFNFLASHDVHVKWAPPIYAVTHQKSITIDGRMTLIMTCNLDSQYYATDRDFGVIDTDAAHNDAIERVFDADFNGQAIVPPIASGLTWSPTQSESTIVKIIDGAKYSLAIENEELSDVTIMGALANAASRGVKLSIVMTLSKNWVDNFNKLAAAGTRLSIYEPDAPLYIHAKVILADAGTANQVLFLGSQNFSFDSLNKNRELGVTLTAPPILSLVAETLAKDFQGGRAWRLNSPNK